MNHTSLDNVRKGDQCIENGHTHTHSFWKRLRERNEDRKKQFKKVKEISCSNLSCSGVWMAKRERESRTKMLPMFRKTRFKVKTINEKANKKFILKWLLVINWSAAAINIRLLPPEWECVRHTQILTILFTTANGQSNCDEWWWWSSTTCTHTHFYHHLFFFFFLSRYEVLSSSNDVYARVERGEIRQFVIGLKAWLVWSTHRINKKTN